MWRPTRSPATPGHRRLPLRRSGLDPARRLRPGRRTDQQRRRPVAFPGRFFVLLLRLRRRPGHLRQRPPRARLPAALPRHDRAGRRNRRSERVRRHRRRQRHRAGRGRRKRGHHLSQLFEPLDLVHGQRHRGEHRGSTAAFLYGYIDFNRDGDFADANERSTVTNIPATSNGAFNVVWSSVPANAGGETATYARFRIGYTNAEVQSPTGLANSGEVEDYFPPIDTLPVTPAYFESERPRRRVDHRQRNRHRRLPPARHGQRRQGQGVRARAGPAADPGRRLAVAAALPARPGPAYRRARAVARRDRHRGQGPPPRSFRSRPDLRRRARSIGDRLGRRPPGAGRRARSTRRRPPSRAPDPEWHPSPGPGSRCGRPASSGSPTPPCWPPGSTSAARRSARSPCSTPARRWPARSSAARPGTPRARSSSTGGRRLPCGALRRARAAARRRQGEGAALASAPLERRAGRDGHRPARGVARTTPTTTPSPERRSVLRPAHPGLRLGAPTSTAIFDLPDVAAGGAKVELELWGVTNCEGSRPDHHVWCGSTATWWPTSASTA